MNARNSFKNCKLGYNKHDFADPVFLASIWKKNCRKMRSLKRSVKSIKKCKTFNY